MSISSVLIANRGEIASRIARTLRRMGIRTIAIYAFDDARSSHVRDVDVALPIGGASLGGTSLAETYLDAAQIVDLAVENGADAVIPGYGFLSEEASFAEAVENAGLTWIGPTPAQMRTLGLKHEARDLATKLGVPLIPGSGLLGWNVDDAVAAAKEVGWPVMLKRSSGGGGGVGMAPCGDEKQLREAFYRLQHQELKHGDAGGGLFLEGCVEHARHVEIQILGSGDGRIAVIGDRDCSAQRRRQKVVEECPALFVPESVREAMAAAAVSMAREIKYRGPGTAEFLFDVETGAWYFLEFNVRLQVEHGVTEAVFGVDLVEAMVNIARGEAGFEHMETGLTPRGVAIEARIYAESPVQDFRPSMGKILRAVLPDNDDNVRVDTWISPGVDITGCYDPLLAKIIVWDATRAKAIARMDDALSHTDIVGVETNVDYIRHLLRIPPDEMTTRTLEMKGRYSYEPEVMEILAPGPGTTVQDYPGRVGLWGVGVPPSGPMDNLSFRFANNLVGNDPSAAGLECTMSGPTIKFRCSRTVALVGGKVSAIVTSTHAGAGERQLPMEQPFRIEAGEVLSVGMLQTGSRVYIAISGGIDVPRVLGSRSTFPLGVLGGLNGRALKTGDLLRLGVEQDCWTETAPLTSISPLVDIPAPKRGAPTEWEIAAMVGPHGTPEYITPSSLRKLFDAEWEVHYNSNRLGVRLNGPSPEWTRQDGGTAGLHASNIHDSPYAVGSVSFTGDAAVVLTCDGPSLGGFVICAVVISSELWKMGQVRAGDIVRFKAVSEEEALVAQRKQEEQLGCVRSSEGEPGSSGDVLTLPTFSIGEPSDPVVCRPVGDRAVLLEFGTFDGFELRNTVQIVAFMKAHRRSPIPGVEDLAPGVRTLLVQYAAHTPLASVVIPALREHLLSLTVTDSTTITSRIVRLPLAFDDSRSRDAVARYAATTRPEAPYLPSNVEFLNALNFSPTIPSDRKDVKDVLLNGRFLVLGLGDVFLGSPLAVPLDPGDRLLGTKYNPTRSSTPRGAVGIGGQYLCVYAAEGGPGGYQLVGRTVRSWDEPTAWTLDEPSAAPCMFRILDQIEFYEVHEAELDVVEWEGDERNLVEFDETTRTVAEYEDWLEENAATFAAVSGRREEYAKGLPSYQELLKPPVTIGHGQGKAKGKAALEGGDDVNNVRVSSPFAGLVFEHKVSKGATVEAGAVLVCIQSTKMEMKIRAPVAGTVLDLVDAETIVRADQDVVILTPTSN